MRTSGKTRAGTPATYVERVNLAVDHVMAHLAEPLRLVGVARAASMSPFHFHRVFQSLMGVTLAEFVKQQRLERALVMMAHSGRPSMTQVRLACGFASSSDFSRCFKQRFGVPPRAFDLDGWRELHRDRLLASVEQTVAGLHLSRLPDVSNPDRFRVRIREMPRRTVAYIRVRNPYKGDAVMKALERLMEWASRRGLADNQWLGYQWENPEITPLEQCRYHVAVEVEDVVARGEVGRYVFPPMLVAQVSIRGGIELEIRALQWLYGAWLPRSGYVPDDQPGFESWIGRPFAHGTAHFELDIQLPIRRDGTIRRRAKRH